MAKKRNKARSRHSLQVVTLCISTAMVLMLIGMVVLTGFTSRNLSSYVKENLTITMILQPDYEYGREYCSLRAYSHLALYQ